MDPRQPTADPVNTEAFNGDVEHYIVGVQSYRAVVHVLEQLPYGQIAATMTLLDRGTTPVFVRERVRELNEQQRKLHDLADVVEKAIHELDELATTKPAKPESSTFRIRAVANVLADACKTATFLNVERVEPAKKE
jgi:hypothetical protein